MKRLLLLPAALLFMASVQSQSKVVFQDTDGSDLADTVEIFYEYGTDHLSLDCFIANTDTVNGYKIRLKRIVKQSVADAKDELCIGMFCNEFLSTDIDKMTAGGDSIYKSSKISTTQPWDLISFKPDSTDGMAIYQYFIIAETGQQEVFVDMDSVVVKYNLTGVGIFDSKLQNNAFIESYPNPVADVVKIRYQISVYSKAVLSVYNMLGQKMFETGLEDPTGIKVIEAQNWESGLYFISIESQGLTLASKKVIKK